MIQACSFVKYFSPMPQLFKMILDIKNDSKNITETEEISDNETKQIEDELRKLGYI